jgi:outer membrane protein OmpA-like peptidoglycan-associated protein
VAQEEVFVAQAVFRFDRSGVNDLLPASVAQVDELLRMLKDGQHRPRSIRLVGYADRLNSTGDPGYNQRLSERRVATVRDLLVAQGIAAASIDTTARGDTNQVENCGGKFKSKAALEACLLPNRRVEIQVKLQR